MKWPLFPGPPIHAASVPLADEGLDLYLIIGICVGGTVFLIFVALLIFYISRRKKQSRRRDGKLPLLLSHRRPRWNPRGNSSWGWHPESGKKKLEMGSFRMSGPSPAVTVCSILWLAWILKNRFSVVTMGEIWEAQSRLASLESTTRSWLGAKLGGHALNETCVSMWIERLASKHHFCEPTSCLLLRRVAKVGSGPVS